MPKRSKVSRRYSGFHILGAFFLGCCVATSMITFFHFVTLSTFHEKSAASSSTTSVHQKVHMKPIAPISKVEKLAANHDNAIHPVAGLDCSEHEGPEQMENAQEMVYWKDIHSDNSWTSPFRKENTRQYLTFEPDGGGWNNIRMSMETVLTMALAMGRVLVLPPSQKMYLLGKNTFNFADFFPLQELAEEHAGLEIISTQQFLEETMGTIRDRESNKVVYPPKKQTAWDGDTSGIKTQLGPWLRSIALNPDWDPTKCIATFPKSTDQTDIDDLNQMMNEILAEEDGKFASPMAYKHFINNPTPVDASAKDRLREFLSERQKLCIYDKEHQDAPIIHFHGKAAKTQDVGGRLLVHFYAFLFFQDWHTDLWMKRFVRDHVRYIDNIQCAAARIVHKLRTSYKEPTFDSFHIRRGDFQYKRTRVDAEEIVSIAEKEIPKGRTVYIGTDERKKSFFRPLKDAGWNILFLDDFKDVVGEHINPNYYGMIDQLVVSRGETFFGCWFSTFTGYIMRLRGYHSQLKLNGSGDSDTSAYEEGLLPNSYYYALKDSKTKMHDYWPVKPVFYAREFPVSWRKLDADLGT